VTHSWIAGAAFPVVEQIQVEIHLAGVFRLERADPQFERHQGLEEAVVEEQVNKVFLLAQRLKAVDVWIVYAQVREPRFARLLHRLLRVEPDKLVVQVGVRHEARHGRLVLSGLVEKRTHQIAMISLFRSRNDCRINGGITRNSLIHPINSVTIAG